MRQACARVGQPRQARQRPVPHRQSGNHPLDLQSSLRNHEAARQSPREIVSKCLHADVKTAHGPRNNETGVMMKTTIGSGRARLALGMMLVSPLATALPNGLVSTAHAQAAPETTDVRLRRIEAELRAVQRKVFPDGAGKTFSAEISSSTNASTSASGNVPGSALPTTTAVTDLLTRMDSVETQLQRLTSASEENQNQVTKLEARLAALEASAAMAGAASGIGSSASTVSTAATRPAAALALPAADGPKPAAKPPAKPDTAKSNPPSDRVAAVMAIEKLVSDDKGEDEYTYGYRLWEAKFLPEAQQQLLRVVKQFPRHTRISYARNLLGRAYLDDGKPGTAAQYFLQNYQADRKGDRAADSLLYLGVAMGRLKEEKRACVAFSEFRQAYPSETIGRLKNQYEAATKPVTCN